MQSTTKRAAKPRATKRKPAVAPEPVPVTAEARERIEAKVSSLEAFGLELAKVLAHPTDGMAMTGEAGQSQPRPGITIEEIGELLWRREQKGHSLGYQRASQDGRRDLRLALQRERAESVAGALLFCVEQLAPVLEKLALEGVELPLVFKEARLELVELVAAMSRHAQRIADGDEQLAGTQNKITAEKFPSRY